MAGYFFWGSIGFGWVRRRRGERGERERVSGQERWVLVLTCIIQFGGCEARGCTRSLV
jgi:hypothetical protein